MAAFSNYPCREAGDENLLEHVQRLIALKFLAIDEKRGRRAHIEFFSRRGCMPRMAVSTLSSFRQTI